MRSSCVLALLVAACALAAVPAWAEPAATATMEAAKQERADAVVLVVDNAYDDGDSEPNRTVVQVGDTVEWRWSPENENRHTVSAFGGSFESAPNCEEQGEPCGHVQREPFRVTFEDPGRYAYRCRVHGLQMTGLVEVEERDGESPSEGASPSPSSSSSPEPSGSSSEPSSEPTSEPSPSPSGSESPRRSPSPSGSPSDDETSAETGQTGADEGEDDDAGDGVRRTSPRTATGPLTGVRETFAPDSERSAGSTSRPASVASPSFEPFPSPQEDPSGLETPDSQASDEAMAVDVPVDGSPSGLLIGIAIGGVTISAGAFAKFVLFQ